MLNNFLKKEYAEKITLLIYNLLNQNEDYIKKQNGLITNDTDDMIVFDLDFTKQYILNYVKNHKREIDSNLKAKGDILIILSYNEPIIMSIIPIVSALIAGNRVFVKPSSRCKEFFKFIWEDESLKNLIKDGLSILNIDNNFELENYIKNVHSVYFFGSLSVAQVLYITCAKYFVEFIPEIETADPKVYFFKNPTMESIFTDCLETLKSSFSHAGQICERISGIYVHKDNFILYKEQMIKAYNLLISSGEIETLVKNKFNYKNELLSHLSDQINISKPKEIIGNIGTEPVIVFEPNCDSDFIKNGFFYPVLWVGQFSSDDHIVSQLKKRKFFLGINLNTDNNSLIEKIVRETRFTRYTTLNGHEKVAPIEGWGGNWPSGSGGYKSWLEHFSVKYTVL